MLNYTFVDASGQVVEHGRIAKYLAGQLVAPEGLFVEWEPPEDVGRVQYEHILANVNLTDEDLNKIIESYIDQEMLGVTAFEFRLSHYYDLRSCAYPDSRERDDAMVKISSSDETIQAEGQAQLDKYYADCLAVKARFPKE